MNLLQVVSGSKSYGSKSLFLDSTFAINQGEHVGVIGPNGAGKTTLFKVITQQEPLDSGEVIRSSHLKVGYLEQEVTWSPETTLEEYLSTCIKPIWELKNLAQGLGLDDSYFSTPIKEFSGGYQMRCKLLYLIGCEPNLMLLDEPTNYLDLETLIVLEDFLLNYKEAFLVISHDREFLRRITDHTLEVESQEITKFPGNIDDYFEQKALLREQLEKRMFSIEAKKKKVMDFVNRFGAKATKARQAQSKLKSLDKLEKVELTPLPTTAKILIPEPQRIGRKSIELIHTDLGYETSEEGKKTILSDINLELLRGDKVGVVGFNGVGKSTLLKALAGRLAPLSGERKLGMDVRIGYYAQHVAQELNPKETILGELQSAADHSVLPQEILDIAGSLLFSGDLVHRDIASLSGGEKSRVALGKILLQKVPVLLLDEVTNHLDFNTVEALTQSLRNYPGTVVLVSHDRGFIARIATKILEIRDGKVIEYPGTYDDYCWSLSKGLLQNLGTSTKNKKKKDKASLHSSLKEDHKGHQTQKEKRHQKKQLERDLRKFAREAEECEKNITQHQHQMEKLNQELEAESSTEKRNELIQELGRIPYEIVALEEKWTQIMEEIQKLEATLEQI